MLIILKKEKSLVNQGYGVNLMEKASLIDHDSQSLPFGNNQKKNRRYNLLGSSAASEGKETY